VKEEQFDLIGNAPVLWFESAMDLLTASAEVARASRETANASDVPFTRSFWPRLMLRAFAIECLIKAHFLLAKNVLCSGGKYVGIVAKERHDLQKLARHAGISLSSEEAHMLDRLSAVATGTGRYPIFKSFDAPRIDGSSERLRIEWAYPKDDIVFRGFILRLIAPLNQRSRHATSIAAEA
jgi:hypothetical protein